MADTFDYIRDQMWYDEEKYRPEVRFDEDGFYRWRYTLDKHHDREMYKRLFIISALISIGGFVFGFWAAEVPMGQLRRNPDSYMTLKLKYQLLYGVLGYAGMFALFALIIGLVRLMEGGSSTLWYRMNHEIIQIKPSGKGSGINALADVKRVELKPEINEIRLVTKWGKVQVLVRSEDYGQIRDHILTHVSAQVIG